MFATTFGTVLAAGVVSFLLTLVQAQGRVQAECESAMDLARRLLWEAEQTAPAVTRTDRVLATVLALREIRHLQVELHGKSPGDARLAVDRQGESSTGEMAGPDVPGWFLGWMESAVAGMEPLRIEHHPAVGTIVVRPLADDESREVWGDLRVAFGHHLLLLLVASLLLSFVIRRSLQPLQELQAAFDRLAHGNFTRPVSEHVPAELRAIHAGFNRTAQLLDQSMRERQTLARRLVGLQEEERSAIARELHDELAPYLFCVRLDAAAHLAVHDDTSMAEIREVFSSIDANVSQIQVRMRELLQRLRPVDLDVHGWPEAMEALLETFRTRFPDIGLETAVDSLEALEDDTARVSLYRVVQECLTNAVRHAGATQVKVTTCRSRGTSASSGLTVVVEDDGRGPPSSDGWGRGLTGMRERMQALGGSLSVTRAGLHGTRVTGCFPLQP